MSAKWLSAKRGPPSNYRGRSIGIVVLVSAQLFVGFIHVFFGLLLFAYSNNTFLQGTLAYNTYTVVFGVLVSFFAWLIWQGKKAGWVGTVAVSLFVIAADSLTLANLPSVPGIPKSAGAVEIAWSLIVIAYLCTKKVRVKFGVA
jgi:hypothetical protein